MEGYFSLAVVIVGFIAAAIITRKDTAANKGLSKKGILRLSVVLVIVFIAVVTEVFLRPESWM
ncbi:hypothetical protein [Robertmurraya kyonggiensis]|uniref:Uncharacterized protein n=1 Tax=Robertmurraya kyonggiensis TaxID=1037680 RepID=A0A4U1CZJ7_9BACI|nr:hypothetical protein [Robertmurraya kyonggiensis]TKC14878.1 hypothetical protein FA727_20440 [Robertmurraya kyonggiensis]